MVPAGMDRPLANLFRVNAGARAYVGNAGVSGVVQLAGHAALDRRIGVRIPAPESQPPYDSLGDPRFEGIPSDVEVD